MKNKKIILGLGTITALGAMSMGFVACKKDDAKKEDNKDNNGGLVYFNDLPEDTQTSIVKKWLEDILTETKTENNTTTKKDLSDFATNDAEKDRMAKNATVSDLVKKIEAIKGFKDKFKIVLDGKEGEKELSKENGVYKPKIIKKDADHKKQPHLLIADKEFKFKLKAS